MSAQAPRYRLLRCLATGGMAQVYEGLALGDDGFERRIAVKRILPELAHEESMRRMFADEARIAARLHHSNIVQVLDYGWVDGSEFLAMEYVDGLDASEALRRAQQGDGSVPVGVGLHIITEVAHALSYLGQLRDEAGDVATVVHRDINPQNILLSWFGDVKVSDFGIAWAQARSERTRTGLVKGKEDYMAPEQRRGGPLTGAADVYALGASLSALLAPDKASHPRPGGSVKMHPDPEVAELIAACCDAEPNQRPSPLEVASTASRLAAAKLAGQAGRSALAEWLAKLRSVRNKVSQFDEMILGACIVGDPVLPRQFKLQHETRPALVPVEGELNADAPQPDAERAQAPPPPKFGRPRRWAYALTVLMLAGVALAWVGRAAPEAEHAAEPTPFSEPPPAVGPEPVTVTSPPTKPAASAAVERLAPPSESDAPSRSRTAPSQVSRKRSTHSTHNRGAAKRSNPGRSRAATAPSGPSEPAAPPQPQPQPSAPTEQSAGWLKVAGRRLFGAAVQVDGQPAGHAPLELKLSVGSHRVVVRRPGETEVLVDQVIDLGPHHTRGSALRITR